MKSNVDRYKRNEYAPTHTADIPYEKVTPNKSQELWFVSEKKNKEYVVFPVGYTTKYNSCILSMWPQLCHHQAILGIQL